MAKEKCSPVEAAIEVICGRWKVLILQELFSGTKRFGEIHRVLERVSNRTLAKQLRELESDGIVTRHVYREVPPKVEYSLTALGDTLRPVLGVIQTWAIKYRRRRRKK